MAYQGEVIWIIGASSGIGHALAVKLATEGATLILSGRRTEALEALRQTIGGVHSVQPMDVTDAANVAQAVSAVRAQHAHIDRVLFMAGQYEPMALDALDMAQATQMVQVNLMGALHVIAALWPSLIAQEYAQFVLCASVVGYMGLPNAQPYGATKAGLINLAESLYLEAPRHVDVKLIAPGFVRTPMTQKNLFKMPALIEPEAAAEAICAKLCTRGFEIHFPKKLTLVMKLLRMLPYGLSLWMLKGLS